MVKLIKSKLRYKIMFFMFVLMTLSSLIVVFMTTQKIEQSNIKSTKKQLNMLNESIFQSLRNAMNTGDPVQIKKSEDDASKIEGVKKLVVAKSQALIDMYSPGEKFTYDSEIKKAFANKKVNIIEYNEKSHDIRMLKPMIATNDCLMCHANQKQGDVIGVMDLTFSLEESDKEMADISLSIIIVSTILGFITLGIIFVLVKKATQPIETLKDAIESMANGSATSDEIKVKSSDEIGEVAKHFNQYIKGINESIKADQKVVEEVERAINMVRSGFFIYEIKSSSKNKTTNDLKNAVNTMIKDLSVKLDTISEALVEYGNANFEHQFDITDASGTIGSIIYGSKALGSNVSEILATIMISGENLSKNIEVLSNSSASLTQSAKNQMQSLKETEKTINQIVNNIEKSSKDISGMSKIADEVTHSATNGSALASKTADSMDEINKEISMINEAVSMIENISFQTNILSLNAAVEAATAGEAGKGFAVVAGEVRNLAERSAEAAKEIKELVQTATMKANLGKEISDDMIKGYECLNEKIVKTKEYIDSVSSTSSEQINSIQEINQSIVTLDNSTKQNSQNAINIDDLSNEIKILSDRLIEVASHATFRDEAREQVCDIDFTYKLNGLKLDHIKFKNENFKKLDSHSKFSVKDETQCNMGKWIIESEQQNKPYTKTQNWAKLKEVHVNVHRGVQDYIDKNASDASNDELIKCAAFIEDNTGEVFKTLNIAKRENCN